MNRTQQQFKKITRKGYYSQTKIEKDTKFKLNVDKMKNKRTSEYVPKSKIATFTN